MARTGSVRTSGGLILARTHRWSGLNTKTRSGRTMPSQDLSNPCHMGHETTTDEVLEGIDLAGMRILLTCASAGLGVESARPLAAHAASLILGVRDTDKVRHALTAAGVDQSSYELHVLDLADLAAVRAFTSVLADHYHLDALMATPGVAAAVLLPSQPPRRRSDLVVVPCPARCAHGPGRQRTESLLPSDAVGVGGVRDLAWRLPRHRWRRLRRLKSRGSSRTRFARSPRRR
jgi:hypothetical protein